jgi:hypothetical protein
MADHKRAACRRINAADLDPGLGVREATMGLAFGCAELMTNESVDVSLLFDGVLSSALSASWSGFSARKRRAGSGADRNSGVAGTLPGSSIVFFQFDGFERRRYVFEARAF